MSGAANERRRTRNERLLLSSDARSLATGQFSRKHYFEESSKICRSGRNALRINDYLAGHRPENTLLEFDQLAARSLKNLSAVREISEFLSFIYQSRRKSLGRLSILFAGRYEETISSRSCPACSSFIHSHHDSLCCGRLLTL